MRLLWLKHFSVLGSVTEWLVYRNISLSSDWNCHVRQWQIRRRHLRPFCRTCCCYNLSIVSITSCQTFKNLPRTVPVFDYISVTITREGWANVFIKSHFVNGFINWPKKDINYLKGSSVYAATFLIYHVPTRSYLTLIKRICMIQRPRPH